MKPVQVSIVIPSYNCASYIREALESVFAQTYRGYEIIIVDSSTDETTSILRSYGDQLMVVWQMAGGVAAARNVGLSKARGQFVALLDADDRWEPDLLETSVAALTAHPQAVMSFTGFQKVGASENGRPSRQRAPFQAWVAAHRTNGSEVTVGNLHPILLWGNVVPTSSVLLRREQALAVGMFDESFPIAEDWEYWLRLTLRHPVAYIDRHLASYRLRDTGLSGPAAGRSQRFLSLHLRALEKHMAQEGDRLTPDTREIIQRRVAALRYRLGASHLKAGEARRAFHEIGSSLRLRKTVGLEFAGEESSWLRRCWLVLKPYGVWAASRFVREGRS